MYMEKNLSHCHNQTVYSPLDLIEASIATEQPEKLFEPLNSFYLSTVHSKSKPSVKKYIICEKNHVLQVEHVIPLKTW